MYSIHLVAYLLWQICKKHGGAVTEEMDCEVHWSDYVGRGFPELSFGVVDDLCVSSIRKNGESHISTD